jgi:ABC-type uncharacterized transport system auxiliary subunit
MMANAKAFALACALISILAGGCISNIKYPSYYTLRFPPVDDPPPKEGHLPSIAVRQFQAPAYLRQGPIVYRVSPEQIGFYEYHRWAVDPRSAITDAVVNRLAASGNFSRVLVYDGRSDVDYILSGKIESLDELDFAGVVAVQVAISAELTEFQSAKTVWANSVADTVKVAPRTVPAIVAEMSNMTDRAIGKLLASIAVP